MPVTVGLTARTVRGLEWVTADEIEATQAGARHIALAPRQVNFTLPEERAGATLSLRTVDDVFVRVGVVRGVGRDPTAPAKVGAALARLDLAGALEVVRRVRPDPDFRVLDVVASLDGDRRFSRYDIEDAAGAEAGRVLGSTYGSRRDGAPPASDLSLRLALSGDRAEVLLRLDARPLHRRPWKVTTGAGTLHPPAAAALVRLAGPAAWVLDPCCGDGTIVVEAALAGSRAFGTDIDADRLRGAAANVRLAALHPALAQADASHLPLRLPPGGAMVTNPPWNRSVGAAGGLAGSLTPLWESAGEIVGDAGMLVVVHEAAARERPGGEMEALGFRILLHQRVRLAGRVAHVAAATRGSGGIMPRLDAWRGRSVAEGVTTEGGF